MLAAVGQHVVPRPVERLPLADRLPHEVAVARGTLLTGSPLAALYAAVVGLVALGVYRAVTGER